MHKNSAFIQSTARRHVPRIWNYSTLLVLLKFNIISACFVSAAVDFDSLVIAAAASADAKILRQRLITSRVLFELKMATKFATIKQEICSLSKHFLKKKEKERKKERLITILGDKSICIKLSGSILFRGAVLL